MRKIKITVEVPNRYCMKPDEPMDGEMGAPRCRGLGGAQGGWCNYFHTQLRTRWDEKTSTWWIYPCKECRRQK